jgi:CheY-like chemotaxis protein
LYLRNETSEVALPDPSTPILVVDDSKAIRAVFDAYLKRLGYTNVRSAATVEEGLAAFREQRSDIVFLDVMLGPEDGRDFARAALDERPLSTLVLSTALTADDDLVTDMVALGARQILVKPIQLNTLKTVLTRLQEARDEEEGIAPAKPAASTPPPTTGYQ